ncbi:zeta toxin family protein [Undibacterium sp. Ji83W]|uniref:zeta toxin family protein n=1 Tax=Undibacterium sp. Ji83W TaxID=3413043 RepID=UPI003BF13176
MNDEGKLSSEIHEKIFKQRIEAKMLASTRALESGEQPVAIFLGGQPGSGKGGLARKTMEELSAEKTVHIDVDNLRENHPSYRSWQRDPATEKIAADLSHADASAWGKSLFSSAIANRRNIMIDGTLGNPQSTEKQINTLKDAGYEVTVRALAVQPEVSHLGVLKRFEEGVQKGAPRWVPREVEASAYEGLPKTLQLVESTQTDAPIQVQVFDRNKSKLYDNRDTSIASQTTAEQALKTERQRPLNASEQQSYSKDWDMVITSMAQRQAPGQEIKEAAKLAEQMCPDRKLSVAGAASIDSKAAQPDLAQKSTKQVTADTLASLSMPATPSSKLLGKIAEPPSPAANESSNLKLK